MCECGRRRFHPDREILALEPGQGDAHSSKGPCAEEAAGWGASADMGATERGASDTRNS